jgi:DNA-binding NarL/FixJ family response regulator
VVAGGSRFLSPEPTRAVIAEYVESARCRQDLRAVLGRLTAPELDLLRLVAGGLSNAEAGSHLKLSVHTVKERLDTIRGKIGAANRVEAAVLAQQAGLLGGATPASATSCRCSQDHGPASRP